MDTTRQRWLYPLGLALLAQALFGFRLATPHIFIFDEVHYVPAARALLDLRGGVNLEHPLFGKTLIALGMLMAGDNALGWRLMSTLAGTATVLALYAIAALLTGQRRAGLVGGALALFGNTVFVQARVAMLDTFMAALLAGGLAMLLWAVRSDRRVWAKWLAGSVLLGLAAGTKWAALPYLAAAGGGLVALRWRRGQALPLPIVPALSVLGAVATAAYFLTFAPALFFADRPVTLAGLLPLQLEMYRLQTQVLPAHGYQSDWWSWPLMLRPIWYLYEPIDGAQRGVLLIANPVLAWGGLAAVAVCGWLGWQRRSLALAAPAILWAYSVAAFAIIPKSLGFYYYYYPSTLWLAVAGAVALTALDSGGRRRRDEWVLAAAVGVFAYFWPVLSAAPLDGASAFQRWAWFDSWI